MDSEIAKLVAEFGVYVRLGGVIVGIVIAVLPLVLGKGKEELSIYDRMFWSMVWFGISVVIIFRVFDLREPLLLYVVVMVNLVTVHMRSWSNLNKKE